MTNARPISLTFSTRNPMPSATRLPTAIWPIEFFSTPAARSASVSEPVSSRTSRCSALTRSCPRVMATASAPPVSCPLSASVRMAALVCVISARTASTERTFRLLSASLTLRVLAASSVCLRSASSSACSQNFTYWAACTRRWASVACFSNALTAASSCNCSTVRCVTVCMRRWASASATISSASFCHCAESATALFLAAV